MTSLPGSAVMIIHGPELFDGGEAAWLMNIISPDRVIVAGVMARTAAEESGLPVEFIALPPSRVIGNLEGIAYLVTKGKTAKTGELFGNIVASRIMKKGLVHIECTGKVVYCWDSGNKELAGSLSRLTCYKEISIQSIPEQQDNYRKIQGCVSGEPVYVNGIIIGLATSETVVLTSTGGRIVPCSGLEPKPHGLEKLALCPPVNLSTAWCKSGKVRSASPVISGKVPGGGRVLVIDHCGHEIYARMPDDCCGVLAIGDDTTSICGHILAHRGIPVLGIVDGDRDVIVPPAFADGSVIAEVLGERDDDVGREIAKKVPEIQVIWDEWVEEILRYLAGRVHVVMDLRTNT
ncbi:MAG: DUF2117 domain-containing protein [Methanoregulaceae archaeon]|nr:DUF2117 domain-containing protein [Methanoregulaceae archaeon]